MYVIPFSEFQKWDAVLTLLVVTDKTEKIDF